MPHNHSAPRPRPRVARISKIVKNFVRDGIECGNNLRRQYISLKIVAAETVPIIELDFLSPAGQPRLIITCDRGATFLCSGKITLEFSNYFFNLLLFELEGAFLDDTPDSALGNRSRFGKLC
jgi:hypothetical protein